MTNLNIRIGGFLVFALVALAIFAPLLSPHNPDTFFLDQQLLSPHTGFWFGHDHFGRDVLSRVLHGARVSLFVGITVVSISFALGLTIGLWAGFKGGMWDNLFLFLSDIFLAFPGFLLAVALAAFAGPSMTNIILILSVLGWVGFARVARGQALQFREKEFVMAAKGIGASNLRLMVRHILPNLMAPMLVQATFGMAGVILVESSLSFLGLGIPSSLPSWGNMLDLGTSYLLVAPHLSIFPGLFIMLVVLGFNFLGDGLRDRLDPKGQGRGIF